jgi:hypothetical protein
MPIVDEKDFPKEESGSGFVNKSQYLLNELTKKTPEQGEEEKKIPDETSESSLTDQTQTEGTEEEQAQEEETSQERSESQLQDQSTASQESTPESDKDFDARAKEWASKNGYMTDDEVEDLKFDIREELEKEYSSKQSSHSEFIQKMIEMEQKGYDVASPSFWAAQSRSLDSVSVDSTESAVSVIVEAEKLNNPYMEESLIKEELEDDYEALFSGDYSEGDKEYDRAKRKLKAKALKSLDVIKNKYSEMKLPENPVRKAQAEAGQMKQEWDAVKPKAERQFNRLLTKHLDANNSLTFNASGTEVTYELDANDMKAIKGHFKTLFDNIGHQLSNKDGLDYSRIKGEDISAQAYKFAVNTPEVLQKMFDRAATTYAAKDKKALVDDLNNTKPPISSSAETRSRDERKSGKRSLAEQASSKGINFFR